MDKIKMLQTRREKLLSAGKNIRAEIEALTDKNSFVELSAFSFSESEYYDGNAEGEGVVCGFATIDDFPYYIIAQNPDVLNGGVSKANCEKMIKCLEQAEKNGTPVIYLLSSLGVRVGEGVNVLEGIASLLAKARSLSGQVWQYLVVNGEVYGQIALLAGICDFTFFIDKKSVLALTSPLVITAVGGENLPKEKVGGAGALNKTVLPSFVVKDFSEISNKIKSINDLMKTRISDCAELNASLPALNKKCDARALLSVFDKGTAIEVLAGVAPAVKCYLARIGGIAVSTVIFDGEGGIKLCPEVMSKLRRFTWITGNLHLPYINFVNTLGVKETSEVANSTLIDETAGYINEISWLEEPKISVVYGKAVGLGYTLFSAKSMGYDFTYAFANAKIALFDSAQGAEIELAGKGGADNEKLAQKYAEENSDPINSAKGGYIDNIIEPAFVRQYLIASLQMLLK